MPEHVTWHDAQGYANSVEIAGGFAFLTTMHSHEGLEAVNIWDPAQPTSVNCLGQLHGPYRDLDISGGIAFMPDEWGLSAVDISDPAHPFESSWLNLGGFQGREGDSGCCCPGCTCGGSTGR